MVEKSCFAYYRTRCSILHVKKCKGEHCSFLKTKKQLQQEEKDTIEKIKNLDRYSREYIIDKYYQNKKKLFKNLEEE